MQSRLGAACAAAVLAAITAAGAVGCSSGGSGAATAPRASANQLLSSSLRNLQGIGSYTAALTVKASGIPGTGGGGITMSGTYSSQEKPSPLREFNATKVQVAQLPIGAMDEVTTPAALYAKMPVLTALTHASKPWVRIPEQGLQQGSATGLDQLLGEVQSVDPLSVARLLAGARNVRTVGTSTVSGAPVTEISGSEPGSAALSSIPASLRSSLGQTVRKLGIKQITFQAWIDGQRNVRKLAVIVTGSAARETFNSTVTSVNKPVNISVPAAGQAETIPASALRGDLGL